MWNITGTDVTETAAILDSCRNELGRRIVGQGEMVNSLLTALIAGGHILLEGVPGLAKTLAIKSLADITGLLFKRIQFTPDLLPADLTGTLSWAQAAGAFSVRRGPVFANLILADELNRAPAKVQSALLEAMEEKQVTIGETTYPLPAPFFVLATQNPIEHEGTYTLPEAELDRFLMKILIRYPSIEEEIQIVRRATSPDDGKGAPLSMTLKPEALAVLRSAAASVFVDTRLAAYMVSIVAASRPLAASPVVDPMEKAAREGLYRYIAFGASPRASIALYRCAQIRALFEGRSFVTPEDVKTACPPVLRHRIVLSYEAEADGLDQDAVISRLLSFVPIP